MTKDSLDIKRVARPVRRPAHPSSNTSGTPRRPPRPLGVNARRCDLDMIRPDNCPKMWVDEALG